MSNAREQKIQKRLGGVPVKYKNQYLAAAQGKGSPRNAIKCQCLECVGYVKDEVIRCTDLACPLYMFRPYATIPSSRRGKGLSRAKSTISPQGVSQEGL